MVQYHHYTKLKLHQWAENNICGLRAGCDDIDSKTESIFCDNLAELSQKLLLKIRKL